MAYGFYRFYNKNKDIRKKIDSLPKKYRECNDRDGLKITDCHKYNLIVSYDCREHIDKMPHRLLV